VGLGLSFAFGGLIELVRRRISNRKPHPHHPAATLPARAG
jgi:hypothetical protein